MAATRSSRLTAPPVRIQDARREMYRQHILAAAEYEFARAGFTEAKVSAIAKAAGISLATLYKHFAGKDDIWDALNAQRMAEFTEAVRVRTGSVDSPLEKILTGARAEVEFFTQRPAFLQMHLNDGWSWGTASVIAAAGRGRQRDAWRTGMEMITRAAEAAVDAGEVVGLRPAIVASVVISSLQVWLADWVSEGKKRPAHGVADELVEHLRACLVRGLSGRDG